MCGALFYMQFTEKSYRNIEDVWFANTICSCHGNSIYCYLPKYGKNSKTWCKEYVRFSNQMSAFAETKTICESRHIKSVVIVSLNTRLIFISKQNYLRFLCGNLKNVEKNLKRDSWHSYFLSLKRIHTEKTQKSFGKQYSLNCFFRKMFQIMWLSWWSFSLTILVIWNY